ncbi:unnamed protein product [Lota lota]
MGNFSHERSTHEGIPAKSLCCLLNSGVHCPQQYACRPIAAMGFCESMILMEIGETHKMVKMELEENRSGMLKIHSVQWKPWVSPGII